MNDPRVVRRLHRTGQRRHQPGRLVRPQRRLAQPVGQAAAGAQLHRQERPPAGPADLVDLDEVRVRQPGRHLRLGLKPRLLVGVDRAGPDHLQRDDAVERHLAGLVDDAHAAPPQLAQDLVPRHGLRRRRGQRRPHRRRDAGQQRQHLAEHA
jgi:hypothetical protein